MTTNVVQFIARHRLTLPNREHWYMVIKQRPGHVNALNNLRGIPRITNGVLMWIETSEGNAVEVHREWFVYDQTENENGGIGTSGKNDTRHERLVARLLEELLR